MDGHVSKELQITAKDLRAGHYHNNKSAYYCLLLLDAGVRSRDAYKIATLPFTWVAPARSIVPLVNGIRQRNRWPEFYKSKEDENAGHYMIEGLESDDEDDECPKLQRLRVPREQLGMDSLRLACVARGMKRRRGVWRGP